MERSNFTKHHFSLMFISGHRSTVAAHMNMRGSKSPMAMGVTYDRYHQRNHQRPISGLTNTNTNNNNNSLKTNRQKLISTNNKSKSILR